MLELILAETTSIMIAHGRSTVRNADRVLVLRQGGHYAELYNTYFRHESLEYVEAARGLARGEMVAAD